MPARTAAVAAAMIRGLFDWGILVFLWWSFITFNTVCPFSYDKDYFFLWF